MRTSSIVLFTLLFACHGVKNEPAPDTTGSVVVEQETSETKPQAPPIKVAVKTPSADGLTPRASTSFVSTDHIVFTAAAAGAAGTLDSNADGALDPAEFIGAVYEAALKPDPAPRSRSAPLRYTLLLRDGERRASLTIEQGEIDTIRQQYIDMSKRRVPKRAEFLRAGASPSGNFRFAEIRSRDGAPWALFSIFRKLDEWRDNYGGPLVINRGYTTPRHNASVNGAAKNSQHLYGTAADVASSSGDWVDKRDAARDAGACTAPLSICGYRHVHGDWRKQCPAGW